MSDMRKPNKRYSKYVYKRPKSGFMFSHMFNMQKRRTVDINESCQPFRVYIGTVINAVANYKKYAFLNSHIASDSC